LAYLYIGIKVLGVVENMADISLSFASLLNPLSGVKLLNAQNEDVTKSMLAL